MISFDSSAFPSAFCAAVLLRIASLCFIAARTPEPAQGALLQRIRTGGEHGFVALSVVLVLSVLGDSRRNAWQTTFFTGSLGTEQMLGLLLGLLMVLSRFHKLEPHSRSALLRIGKDFPFLLIGSGLLSSIDYSEPLQQLLYGIRVIAYPVLLILILLQRRGRRASEDVPSQEIAVTRPALQYPAPTSFSIHNQTVNHVTNIHVENHFHVTQQIVAPSPKPSVVEVQPLEAAPRPLLAQLRRGEISWPPARELTNSVARKLLGKPAGSDDGETPS